MIGPDELRELLHSHAATVEPVPHLAELGAVLTNVERHRRNRVFVGTTIAAVAVTAAVAAVRTLEARPTRFDTAPATATPTCAGHGQPRERPDHGRGTPGGDPPRRRRVYPRRARTRHARTNDSRYSRNRRTGRGERPARVGDRDGHASPVARAHLPGLERLGPVVH